MSTLAERMRQAADTLEEFHRRYEYGVPDVAMTNAVSLRKEADHVQAEDDLLQEQLDVLTDDIRAWDECKILGPGIAAHLVHKLIQLGWRKGDPE